MLWWPMVDVFPKTDLEKTENNSILLANNWRQSQIIAWIYGLSDPQYCKDVVSEMLWGVGVVKDCSLLVVDSLARDPSIGVDNFLKFVYLIFFVVLPLHYLQRVYGEMGHVRTGDSDIDFYTIILMF